jgi:hypothetical protein
MGPGRRRRNFRLKNDHLDIHAGDRDFQLAAIDLYVVGAGLEGERMVVPPSIHGPQDETHAYDSPARLEVVNDPKGRRWSNMKP